MSYWVDLMPKKSTILVLIDCKTLICKRFSGKTCVLKVQATDPIHAYEVEMIRARPEQLLAPSQDPESA